MRTQLEAIGEVECEISDLPTPKMAEAKAKGISVTLTSIVSILLSIPIILSGLWLAYYNPQTSCLNILHWPIIFLGASISVVAILGLLGSIWRLTWLVLLYFLAMSATIAALATLVALVYVATSAKNSVDVVDGALGGVDTYQPSDYHLNDFTSGWFRRRVEGVGRWDSIRECLSASGICSELNQEYRISQDFLNADLTPIQAGCCKPPKDCGYSFVNPTYWINPANTAGGIDCLLWSNNQTELCYQCSACKAGFLANVSKQWRSVDLVLFVALVGLVLMYLFGCGCSIWRVRARAVSTSRDKRNPATRS